MMDMFWINIFLLLSLEIAHLKASTQDLEQIVADMHKQQRIETLFLLQRQQQTQQQQQRDCLLDNFKSSLPALRLAADMPNYMKPNWNKELLTLVCQTPAFDIKIMNTLALNLSNMRQTRIVLILDGVPKGNLLEQIASFCAEQSMTNVLLVTNQRNGSRHATGFRLQPFPNGRMCGVVLNPNHVYFPTQWRNFAGKIAHTLPDQIEPRTLYYVSPKTGRRQLSGVVGKLFLLFAERHNIQLRFLDEVIVGEVRHSSVLKNLTEQGLLDFPITVSDIALATEHIDFTHVVFNSKWFIMVPCAQNLPIADIYQGILSHKLTWLVLCSYIGFSTFEALILRLFWQREITLINLVLNETTLPGLLGQTFKLHNKATISLKQLHMLIFFLGLILNTTYSANLRTLLTNRPSQKGIRTFEDLRQSDLSIVFIDVERSQVSSYLGNEFFNYALPHKIFVNGELFAKLRISMNINFGYTVTSGLWDVLEKQQSYFKRAVFCSYPGLYIAELLLFACPIQLNSVYKEPLNRLILDLNAGGFIEFWQRISFQEMLTIKKFTRKDPLSLKLNEAIAMTDLKWVWFLLMIGLVLSACGFFLELGIKQIVK